MIFFVVKLAIRVSALLNLFLGSMISKQISDIKAKQLIVFNYMQTLDDEAYNNHNYIVKIVTSVISLYKYTHQYFKNISD